jgi:DNA polymerase III epsilon subunit family exonuclease
VQVLRGPATFSQRTAGAVLTDQVAVPTSPRLAEVSFVVVDVETTGLNPRRDKIVEIGAVRVQNGQFLEEFDTLVFIDDIIPTDARRVHGINNDMLHGQPPIREAMNSFLAFAADGVLVEHSYRAFDIAFLQTAHGQPLSCDYVNTCTLSRKLFPFIPRHSLNECCRRHKIPNDRAHRALSDARATAQLLLCLLQVCGSRYPNLADLVQVASVQR